MYSSTLCLSSQERYNYQIRRSLISLMYIIIVCGRVRKKPTGQTMYSLPSIVKRVSKRVTGRSSHNYTHSLPRQTKKISGACGTRK